MSDFSQQTFWFCFYFIVFWDPTCACTAQKKQLVVLIVPPPLCLLVPALCSLGVQRRRVQQQAEQQGWFPWLHSASLRYAGRRPTRCTHAAWGWYVTAPESLQPSHHCPRGASECQRKRSKGDDRCSSLHVFCFVALQSDALQVQFLIENILGIIKVK